MDGETAVTQDATGLAAVSEALEALRRRHPGLRFGRDERGWWAAGRPGEGWHRGGTLEELDAAVSGGPVPDPVDRKAAWLAEHPGGRIGYPQQGQLLMAAAIGDDVIAKAYDNLAELMDRVGKAEAAGKCPLHPGAGS